MTDPKVCPAVRRAVKEYDSPLKALAIELARRIDDPDTRAVASVARELRATLRELDLEHLEGVGRGGEGPPADEPDEPEVPPDVVDDLAAARAERRARASGA